MVPTWLTLYLDVAPDEHAAAVAFWEGVTGYPLSSSRGEHGEYATLLPPDGDAQLRVQRLDDGPSGVHLDVHVPGGDIDAGVDEAVGLGASVVARPGHAVLRSPGGFPFCLVHEQLSRPPEPTTWPDGHRSRVDQLCVDIPPAAYDAEVAFWSAFLEREPEQSGPEFVRLHGEPWLRVLLQRLDTGDGPVRGHVDLATDDRAAEVERLVGLGATPSYVGRAWTALRPPAGPVLCVTDRLP